MKEVRPLSKIFLTSDLHFGHDKRFVWGARGFSSIEEMNEAIILNWNSVVKDDDDIYILGDVALGGYENIDYLKKLKGKIHIVLGNHDSSNREILYKGLPNVVEVAKVGIKLRYKKYNFILTHYPMMTPNIDKESLKQTTLNLYGHTHQVNNFYQGMPYMYHVGVDSHDCYPVLLDDIIEEMKAQMIIFKDMGGLE